MRSSTVILIVIIVLALGIIIGYLILPSLVQSTEGIGGNVFGSSPGVSPPTLPP